MTFQTVELSAANRPELFPEETLLFVQDAVGLYEGKYKLPDYQNGHIYLTSHRICYIDNVDPRQRSTAIPLKHVERCEHFAGFLKSSPKVTLYPKPAKRAGVKALTQHTSDLSLARSPPRSSNASPFPRSQSPSVNSAFVVQSSQLARITWICPICSFSNALPAGFDATIASEQTPLPSCQTCGIKPPLAHLLKAAISNASAHSTDGGLLATRGAQPASLKDGSHQAAIIDDTRPSHICPRCTFDNHPSLTSCEMCGASLAAIQDGEFNIQNASYRSESPAPNPESYKGLGDIIEVIKLSFRSSGDKIFFERLKNALIQRKWLADHAPPVPFPQYPVKDAGSRSTSGANTPELKGVGIAGLERRGLEKRRNNQNVISTAFEDLEALMASAQEIINLAESFADKSSNTSASDIIQDAAVGMATTKDMLSSGGGSESLYHSELARELAEYLTNDRVGALRRAGGIMSLVDLWAEFNSLRNGVELISPSDFEKAARLWERLLLPVRLRSFRNGLLVVQRHDQSDEKTISQILNWMQELHHQPALFSATATPLWDVSAFGRGVTAQEVAARFGWSVGVAVEELELAEEKGVLCREEGIEGLKYWENWITNSIA